MVNISECFWLTFMKLKREILEGKMSQFKGTQSIVIHRQSPIYLLITKKLILEPYPSLK